MRDPDLLIPLAVEGLGLLQAAGDRGGGLAVLTGGAQDHGVAPGRELLDGP